MVIVPETEAKNCEPFSKETSIGTMFLYVLKHLRSNMTWSVAPVSRIQRLEHLLVPLDDFELSAKWEVETEFTIREGWAFDCLSKQRMQWCCSWVKPNNGLVDDVDEKGSIYVDESGDATTSEWDFYDELFPLTL